ncbi:MAG: peptidase M3 [Deltaproteobacteria bacterium]|nr:peptidase M3 [Deltaproteobacteria bacterium]
MDRPEDVLESINLRYAKLHEEREDLFWRTRMGLSSDDDGFVRSDAALTAFRQDKSLLELARSARAEASGDTASSLAGWIRFFEANAIEDASAGALRDQLARAEAELARARREMPLGYVDPETNELVRASSVKLGLALTSEPNEHVRRACYRGLESIEDRVLEAGFLDVVGLRNRFARSLGYSSFYEYKLRTTEGIGTVELRAWLEDLEARTREPARALVHEVCRRHGEPAREPWNFRFFTAGDAVRSLDPHMPFSSAVDRWGRSFSAMGIRFEGAELVVDLVDRPGKYENGFCHAPVPPWIRRDGSLVRARIGFTSNAVPGQVGSGHRAAETLFHEGGHAAHFAGIRMGAPCFSQEYAPTSAAFAETQSMFMDSLLEDADWLSRYAGVPFHLVESYTRATHPLRVIFIRNLLAVAFAELSIYALSDEALTPLRVRQELTAIERELTFLDRCPRPTLSVPHLLDFDSSAIYHGYILAEAAVAQTRAAMISRFGHIVDQPEIGPTFRDIYWRTGNQQRFTELVERMTGSPFSVASLAEDLARSTDEALKEQRRKVEVISRVPAQNGRVTLDVALDIVHGAELIASTRSASFESAASSFAMWLAKKSPS